MHNFWITGASGATINLSANSGKYDFLGNPPPGAPGVEVAAWFPSHPRLQFPLGEQARLYSKTRSLSNQIPYRVSFTGSSLPSTFMGRHRWNVR